MAYDLVQHELGNKSFSLFLFGSQANNDKLTSSDFDLGIECNSLTFEKMLRLRFLLNETLPTLFSFDLIDFNSVSDSFKKVALLNKEQLNA